MLERNSKKVYDVKMKKRGSKPKGKVKCIWSPEFAYAIGLIVTDGCLSNDGRHISFVSKDKEQINNFMQCLKIKVKIGTTAGYNNKKVFRVQFGDIMFYRFLENIGLSKVKSKILDKIDVPNRFFFDFLRGIFDGDGYSYSYLDPRWKSSFMFYAGFVSASIKHVRWLREIIQMRLGLNGHITTSKRSTSCYQLKYAKKESLVLFKKVYKGSDVVCLTRKRLKIENMLDIVGEKLFV